MTHLRVGALAAVGAASFLLLVSYPLIAFIWHGAASPGLAANVAGALSRDGMVRGLLVSLLLVVIGGSLSLVMTLLAAYAASNLSGWQRTVLTFAVGLPLFLRGGIIPFYMVVRAVGLSGSAAAMVIRILGSPIMVLLLLQVFRRRGYREIVEAGRIDGARELRILTAIVCPAAPWAVALPLVTAALEFWNSWIPAFLFVNDSKLYPFQIVIRDMAAYAQSSLQLGEGHGGTPSGVIAAAGLIALVPSIGIALLVAFRSEAFAAQRRFR